MPDAPATPPRPEGELVIGACEACWTDSWAPIRTADGCALVHPHGGEHVVCQYCGLSERYVALTDDRDRLAEEARRLREALRPFVRGSVERIVGHRAMDEAVALLAEHDAQARRREEPDA